MCFVRSSVSGGLGVGDGLSVDSGLFVSSSLSIGGSLIEVVPVLCTKIPFS